MPRRAVLAVFVLVATPLAGCSTIFKNDYWEQLRKESDAAGRTRINEDPTETFFLGVRVKTKTAPYQVGLRVDHAYAEGPAAKAGIRAGDEIRKVGGRPVTSPGDVRWLLGEIYKLDEASEASTREFLKATGRLEKDGVYVPMGKASVVYARSGQEVEVQVDLTTREGYLDLRRQRLLDLSHYVERGSNGWGFIKTRTVKADFIREYYGLSVLGEIRIARDVDILPLVFGISLVRVERVKTADATRVTILCSLLQFSSRGEDVAATLEGLEGVPGPPSETTDL